MIRIKPDGLSISAGHRLNLGLKPYPIAWSTSGSFGIKNCKKTKQKTIQLDEGGKKKEEKEDRADSFSRLVLLLHYISSRLMGLPDDGYIYIYIHATLLYNMSRGPVTQQFNDV